MHATPSAVGDAWPRPYSIRSGVLTTKNLKSSARYHVHWKGPALQTPNASLRPSSITGGGVSKIVVSDGSICCSPTRTDLAGE